MANDQELNGKLRLAVSACGQVFNYVTAGNVLLALQHSAGLASTTSDLNIKITEMMTLATNQPGTVFACNISVYWLASDHVAGTVQLQHIIQKGVSYWRVIGVEGLNPYLISKGIMPNWFTEELFGNPAKYIDFDPTVPDEIPSRFKWWYVLVPLGIVLLLVVGFLLLRGGI